MKTRIGRWGNSLAVLIPGSYAKDLDWKDGTLIEMSRVHDGLLLQPVMKEFTLTELLKRVKLKNLPGETNWGEAAGREIC